MVLSLGLVLAVVAIVVLITLRQTPEAVKVVDATPVVQAVEFGSPYPALAPTAIDGWRVTSARVSDPGAVPFRWHIGYYTSTGRYAAAGQSDGPAAKYLREEKAAGATTGTVTIDGQKWTVLERADGERTSLVRTEDGVTTLVTGTGDVAELTVLAKALRPLKATATGLTPRPTQP